MIISVVLLSIITIANMSPTVEVKERPIADIHDKALERNESSHTSDHKEVITELNPFEIMEKAFDRISHSPENAGAKDKHEKDSHSNAELKPKSFVIDLSHHLGRSNNNEPFGKSGGAIRTTPIIGRFPFMFGTKLNKTPFFSNHMNSINTAHQSQEGHNEHEAEVIERSGPGFQIIEIKRHPSKDSSSPFADPFFPNLTDSRPDPFPFDLLNGFSINHNIDNHSTHSSESPFQHTSRTYSSFGPSFHIEKSIPLKDPLGLFSHANSNKDTPSKPKLHIEIISLPKTRNLQPLTKKPFSSKVFSNVDNAIESFFDGFLDGMMNDSKHHRSPLNDLKHGGAHINSIQSSNTNVNAQARAKSKDEAQKDDEEFNDMEKIFDGFFGNDRKKKSSSLKPKSKIAEGITKHLTKENPKKQVNSDKSGRANNDVHADSLVPKHKGELDALKKEETQKEAVKELVHTITNKETNSDSEANKKVKESISLSSSTKAKPSINNKSQQRFKQYWDKSYFSEINKMPSKKVVSVILKYLTWAVLVVLVALILYVLIWIFFGMRKDFDLDKQEKSYNIDDLEDELKSINRSRKNKYF
eukprot:CAMPEP_0170514716 /NCGR_PEP_ID=MMETSP0209-20121228/1285_1 /TAXON_ID=665100 ORGANISM="Litonotus pictus, Strain P1" /NCGR_SAMPLE_ID=MMETSP0209 /ASSEMBLY_ACC=CAM_ASM_000301 /LENGTH=584 /DNA_ID=CAMNT_0010798917 /DNA_START=26 /DNA_END=1780 /DNA_ORIENTATION=+